MQRTRTLLLALLALLVTGELAGRAQNAATGLLNLGNNAGNAEREKHPAQTEHAASVTGTVQKWYRAVIQRSANFGTPRSNFAFGDPTSPLIISADTIVESVAVHDRPLTLAGHVTGDVMAVNCAVLIAPGAQVDGNCVVVGGELNNQVGDKVRVTQMSGKMLPAFANAPMHITAHTSLVDADIAVRKKDWSGGQFALLLLGLLSGAAFVAAAPRVLTHAADRVALEPTRCLGYGFLSLAGMLVALGINANLMHSPLGVLYAPIGAMVAVGLLAVLALGWICGMRYAGQRVAQRFRKSDAACASGSSVRLIKLVSLGLTAFFLTNVILGGLNTGLGVLSLTLEFGFAVMGLGALLLTRFGTRAAVSD